MFTEYQSTRARKSPEELASGKDWQVNARRLYIPLSLEEYGLEVRKWEEDIIKDGKPAKKKRHAITWKSKPYCKLLLNNTQGAQDFAQLQVNTSGGLAVQVDPANYKRVYVSIPKGALGVFPKVNAMLNYKRNGATYTLSAK